MHASALIIAVIAMSIPASLLPADAVGGAGGAIWRITVTPPAEAGGFTQRTAARRPAAPGSRCGRRPGALTQPKAGKGAGPGPPEAAGSSDQLGT